VKEKVEESSEEGIEGVESGERWCELGPVLLIPAFPLLV